MLHEIYINGKNSYIVEAHNAGYVFLEAFYSGLNQPAKVNMKIYPLKEVTIGLARQDRDICIDRVAITLVVEKRDESHLYTGIGYAR